MKKTYVSFLGTGTYKPCVYLKPDDPASDSGVVTYVQTAMRKLVACGAEKALIFCTRDAAETHWQKLCAEFEAHGLPEPEKADIPGGSSVEEFWEIFETVNEHIPEEAEIVFDVTHSFRSLPLMMSVLLNYLEVVKGTKLVGCYYGAFETLGRAPDVVEKEYPEPADRRAPIFDLTPFFQLNDWVKAIRDFKRFGDAGDLNRLAKQDTKHEVEEKETRTDELLALRSLTGALNDFTQMVRTSRCKEIQAFAFKERILERLEKAMACGVLPQLKPVLAGLGDVFAAYQDKDLKNGIRAARWAYEHDLIPQGYTLLQETIVSHYAQEFAADLKRLYPKREDEVKRREFASALLAWRTGSWKKEDSGLAEKLKDKIVPEVLNQYNALTQGRNDINHGGHSHNARKAEKLKKDLGDAIEAFESLLLDNHT